jgi:hypothetical protein
MELHCNNFILIVCNENREVLKLMVFWWELWANYGKLDSIVQIS